MVSPELEFPEILLGFDAREMWYYHDVKTMGAQKNDSIGFLRDGVTKGLTVGSSIWPSVFNDGEYLGLEDRERKLLGLGTIKLPEFIGRNRPLWNNLEYLEQYLKEKKDEIIKPYWIIAITKNKTSELTNSELKEWPYPEITVPPVRNNQWRCIGFDIADRSMESHLTGTSFSGNKNYIKSLCGRWGPCLNQYHLLEEIREAYAFKNEVVEKLDPVNKPYFIYGIWLIKEITDI